MKTSTPPVLIIFALVCFALIKNTQAVSPPPDGCYPNFTTAEGCNALRNLVGGAANTGVGSYALSSDVQGNFNTAVGGGALVLNTGDNNTAVGAAALLLNTSGADNTAVGKLAGNNITGNSNTCLGTSAGSNLIDGEGNIYIGAQVQASSTNELETIRIGNDSAFTFPYDTYVAGIFNRDVDMTTATFVFVDGTGKLGTAPVDANGNKVVVPTPQVMLNDFLEAQTRVAELEDIVERLAATVKEQATQIEKVSAQLEANKPAPQMVKNP
jgi:hypothetical protein